jgi:hypothetical protein
MTIILNLKSRVIARPPRDIGVEPEGMHQVGHGPGEHNDVVDVQPASVLECSFLDFQEKSPFFLRKSLLLGNLSS